MAFRRLPNNYGTVYRLSGNRRNPWIARKRVGEKYDDEKHTARPVYHTIGYYPTRKDALAALALVPENLPEKQKVTFGEVYDAWVEDKFGDKGLPKSYHSASLYISAMNHRDITAIRAADIETLVNDDSIPRTVKHPVMILMRSTFDYAVRHEIVDKDYASLAKPRMDMATKKKKAVFSHDEVESVWNLDPSEKRDMVLILLYTGMRINECLKLTVDMVHMDERYIITGSKSEAGRDRVIPIHHRLVPVIQHRLDATRSKLFHYSRETGYNYVTRELGHTPHECRHSFATQAMECGMHDEARKRILGHASVGVTNKVYTHLDVEFLLKEIEKLEY